MIHLDIDRDVLCDMFGDKELERLRINYGYNISIRQFIRLAYSKIMAMKEVINVSGIMNHVKLVLIDGTEGSGKSTIFNNEGYSSEFIYDPLIFDNLLSYNEVKNIKKVKFPRRDGSSVYGDAFYDVLCKIDKVPEEAIGAYRVACITLATLDRLDWLLFHINTGDVFIADRSHITNIIAHKYYNDICMQRFLKFTSDIENDIFDNAIILLRDITYDIVTKRNTTYEEAIDRITKSLQKSRGKDMTYLDRLFIEQNDIVMDLVQAYKLSNKYIVTKEKAFYRIIKKPGS